MRAKAGLRRLLCEADRRRMPCPTTNAGLGPMTAPALLVARRASAGVDRERERPADLAVRAKPVRLRRHRDTPSTSRAGQAIRGGDPREVMAAAPRLERSRPRRRRRPPDRGRGSRESGGRFLPTGAASGACPGRPLQRHWSCLELRGLRCWLSSQAAQLPCRRTLPLASSQAACSPHIVQAAVRSVDANLFA